MRAAGFLAMAVLAWLPPGQGRAAACPAPKAAQIRVDLVDPNPVLVTTASLKQINASANSHGLVKKGALALGLTESEVEASSKMRFVGEPDGDALCVGLTEMEVRFGHTKFQVHLPKEYPKGTCQYDVVHRHEMAHVDVYRSALRKYAAIMREELKRTVRSAGAVRAATMTEGQQALQGKLQKVTEDVTHRFEEELRRLHAEIDAPGSPYDPAGACKGW